MTNIGRLGLPGFVQSLDPFGLEHVARILQLAGGCHDHLGRHGDANGIVAEFQRELTAAEKLLVLPPGVVGVRNDAGEPLGDFVNVVLVLFEELVTATCLQHTGRRRC